MTTILVAHRSFPVTSLEEEAFGAIGATVVQTTISIQNLRAPTCGKRLRLW